MRAAALAVAVFGAFIGVMYLRFSGDAVPEPPPRPSGEANVAANCFVFRVVGAPDPTPRSADAPPTRVPCSTVNPSDAHNSFGIQPPPPSPPPPPTVLAGVDVVPLGIGPHIPFPSNIAFIVLPLCVNCGGALEGLTRVYYSNGGLRMDTLVTLESLGFSLPPESDPSRPYFTGYVTDEDGSAIAVSVCKRGPCFNEPAALSPAEAETAIFLSLDGGISWSEVHAPGRVAFVSAVLPDQRLLVGVRTDRPEAPDYWLVPGDERLTSPEGTLAQPVLIGDGRIGWPLHDGRIVTNDGSLWPGKWADPQQIQLIGKLTYNRSLERIAASVSRISQDVISNSRLVVVLAIDGSLQNVYSTSGFVGPIAWLDANRILVTFFAPPDKSPMTAQESFSGPSLAIMELDRLRIRPLQMNDLNADDELRAAMNNVLSIQQGPFARVVNTENTCLNIRAEPLPSAGVLDCAAEGVLLRDLGQGADIAGTTWLRVATPAGIEGWASTQYLER
jgi:hypothetical protein